MRKSETTRKLKSCLEKKNPKELKKLVLDLYGLNKENRHFIETRCAVKDKALEPYKDIIKEAVDPEFDTPIRLAVARKAISDYKKASGDHRGVLDLMIYYVETGTACTLNYGDMYEAYYDSLESMFTKAVKELQKCSRETINAFVPRLKKIVEQTEGMGWGYHDYLADCFGEAFPDVVLEFSE